MKAQSFATRLIQLNKYLPYVPPDNSGQLVASLPDDNIKEILHHAMPNMWEKKMVEEGYNYLDSPIHSMTEFFEIMIENLEKSIPLSVPSRNNKKSKKGPKKKKFVTSGISKDEDSEEEQKVKEFCQQTYYGQMYYVKSAI